MNLTRRIVAAATMIPSTLLANGFSQTCENLIDSIKSKQSNFLGIKEVFECGPERTHTGGKTPAHVDGCLVFFATQLNPYSELNIAAFDDSANKLRMDWIVPVPSKGIASGWETSGKYICSDIKTYVRVKPAGETAEVEVSRETASDAMFCPFRKLVTSYQTTCRKVSQD